jgi:hypothetical protein
MRALTPIPVVKNHFGFPPDRIFKNRLKMTVKYGAAKFVKFVFFRKVR